MSSRQYKETPIDKSTDNTVLFAIRNLCNAAISMSQNISVFDDGEWDFKLNKVLRLFRDDIDELANIDIEQNEYSGELSLEKLIDEWSDFYYLLGCTSPLGSKEAQFIINYEFLEKKVRDNKPSIYVVKHYFWDEIHSRIKEVSQIRLNGNHHADAVEAAFKEVIKRVKDFVNIKTDGGFDGDRAMNRAFGFENQSPLIKFNKLSSIEERSEQKGIMNLFKGIVGIRNRKAHENIILDDKNRALEYLALASLLMRLLDEHAK